VKQNDRATMAAKADMDRGAFGLDVLRAE